MPKIIQGKFKILSNKKVGPDYFKMIIGAPQIAQAAHPGQFVHLLCKDGFEPLLRRPFSFHRLDGNNFEILYKVIGLGTKLLSKKRKGDKIDVLGPLGDGFVFRLTTSDYRLTTILVAGGMGVAPLLALAQSLVDRKRITVLIGAKTRDAILCAKDFRKLGAKVQVATDNGSLGHKGLVTELLKKVLRTRHKVARRKPWRRRKHQTTIYACGPKPMLKEVARISELDHLTSFGSLEENMACGLGACLGCVVKTRAGFKQVCKDGPVFNLQEIRWGRG